MVKKLDVWETFKLRRTCTRLHDCIPTALVKNKWEIEKREVEKDMLRNRTELLEAFTKAKLTINMRNAKIHFEGNKENLLKALKDNEEIHSLAYRMQAEYKEEDLRQDGYRTREMIDLRPLLGGNLWTVDIPNSLEGILIIPRELGPETWCGEHQQLCSFINLELTVHRWVEGVDHTACNVYEDSFTNSRIIPLYARRHRLVELMEKMQMYPAGNRLWFDRTTAPDKRWERTMWLPSNCCPIDGQLSRE